MSKNRFSFDLSRFTVGAANAWLLGIVALTATVGPSQLPTKPSSEAPRDRDPRDFGLAHAGLHTSHHASKIVCMRTTISLDDRIFEAVKRRAAAEGRSVSGFIASVLDDALKRDSQPEPARPFRLVTAGGGGAHPGIDLDRPRELLAAEDEQRYG